MKSFDLNSYGVQEMSVQEMKEVGGGVTLFKMCGGANPETGKFEITCLYIFGFRII
jgi:hypothetical protein